MPPADLVSFYRKLQEGYDCVFGSRFSRGGRVVDYPALKLVLNRLGNRFIQLLFRFPAMISPMHLRCIAGLSLPGSSRCWPSTLI